MSVVSNNTDHTAFDLETGLQRLGYQRFRAGQREAVETLLRLRRLLFVAPTGDGKSLVYQLPASLLPGTTVVVSPLISLMHDQVAALSARGIPATYLASTLAPDELRKRMAAMRRCAYKLVYAAPERLAFDGFRSMLTELACPLIAIDEAHCISEWGHDFRPEYLQIGELLQALPDARVLACTATATPVVRDEIIARLGLPIDTAQIVRGFARPNLALRVCEVTRAGERTAQVDSVLRETLGDSVDPRGAAIVYAPTRKATNNEAARLCHAGWPAGAYHAGLGARDRNRVQTEFCSGELSVVVATNAFGMGIDRADVRCVVHLAPPGSIEAYYQEVGRAGRDGKEAVGLLLISPGDMALRRYLIEGGAGTTETDRAMVEHKWNLFLELMRWAEGGSCRHDAILRYFGDEAETLSGCGHCDVCRNLTAGAGDDPEEVTLIVRKALSAVARVHARLGLAAAAKLLRGAPDPRLARSGLSKTRTFGVLADYSEEWLVRLLRRCITAGWVAFDGGDRPVVVLTASGRAVMKAERPVNLLLPEDRAPSSRRSGRCSPMGRLADPSVPPRRAGFTQSDAARPSDSGESSQELFDALRRYRRKMAGHAGLPPYVIASDRTLRDIAASMPRTIDQLMLVHGIGPAKAARYGAGLLAVVTEHCQHSPDFMLPH